MNKCLIILMTVSLGTASAQKTYLHCGQLIDGIGTTPQSHVTIVVEGNKILSIQKGYSNPDADGRVIDLRNKTVMPGLIDMHVHLEGETSKSRALERFTLNDADIAFRSTISEGVA